jgi:hypothetical protein
MPPGALVEEAGGRTIGTSSGAITVSLRIADDPTMPNPVVSGRSRGSWVL